MSRLMSVALTKDQVRARRKTVTRRGGWEFLKVGERVTLCEKVMGRRHGEPLTRIVDVEIVDVRRESLDAITDDDVTREGFTGLTAAWFVDFYTREMKCQPDSLVTRIEWAYLTAPDAVYGPERDAALWNEAHPVGMRVRFWPMLRAGAGIPSTTRSEAWVMGGHTAVVMVEGYAGGISLGHVEPTRTSKEGQADG